MRKHLLFIILSLLLCTPLSAQLLLSDSAKIYLLTCTPGTEVWSKYGHTGIRVCDPANKLDIVFNYGIFSLMDDGFYLKFVKGDTYYQLGIEPYNYFLRFYKRIGRTTYQQELNLTPAQKQQVFDALMVNYQPENRVYHYNFVFDNCATRPYHLLKQALQDTIISPYQGYKDKPFRSTISHYTGPYSWVDLGINLVFGKKADQLMTNEERLFLPEELMYYMSQATLSDGTPLVLNEQIAPFEVAPVPWYADCRLGLALLAIIIALISWWDRRRNRLSWWLDAILGVVYLVLLTIVIFLTFFSVHPLVGFSWRLLIIPLIHICARLIYWLR